MSTTEIPLPAETAVAGGGAGDPATAAPRVSARLRCAVAAVLVPVALYTAACLVYNAPPSPAKVRVAGPVATVMNPYFAQDWMLFAPTPSTSNDLLLMDVQLVRPGADTVVTTAPVDIEAAIDRMPRANRVLPSKLPGVLLAFQEVFPNFADQLNTITRTAPADRQAALKAALSARFAPQFAELQRFLSARAASMYPGVRIVAVRAAFYRRPIVPFSQRDANPPPPQPLQGVLRTGWMPFVPGVAE